MYSKTAKITATYYKRDGSVHSDSDTGEWGIHRIRGWVKSRTYESAIWAKMVVEIDTEGYVVQHTWDGDTNTWESLELTERPHTCVIQETPDGMGCVTCLYT